MHFVVGVDWAGHRRNADLPLPAPATVEGLRKEAERVFTTDAVCEKGAPWHSSEGLALKITAMRIYDAVLCRWGPLMYDWQLRERTQIWCLHEGCSYAPQVLAASPVRHQRVSVAATPPPPAAPPSGPLGMQMLPRRTRFSPPRVASPGAQSPPARSTPRRLSRPAPAPPPQPPPPLPAEHVDPAPAPTAESGRASPPSPADSGWGEGAASGAAAAAAPGAAAAAGPGADDAEAAGNEGEEGREGEEAAEDTVPIADPAASGAVDPDEGGGAAAAAAEPGAEQPAQPDPATEPAAEQPAAEQPASEQPADPDRPAGVVEVPEEEHVQDGAEGGAEDGGRG